MFVKHPLWPIKILLCVCVCVYHTPLIHSRDLFPDFIGEETEA